MMQLHPTADIHSDTEYSSGTRSPESQPLLPPDAEASLWQSFKMGNQLAFSTLYTKYVQHLYNYGRHLSADHELVKDCLQELFTELWSKRESLSDIQSVRHYLFKSFRRRLIGELIKRRKTVSDERLLQHADFEPILPLETELIQAQLNQEQCQHLKYAVNELTKRQKEAVFLKFYGNMSYPEVASVMQMQVDSVYNVISKALDVLRKNLKRITLLLPLLLGSL